MSQFERNIELLNRRRIVYRRLPEDTSESKEFYWGWYYEDGTYECYDLFRSKAKITTYKSLKWHLLVLWYLNPQLNPNDFEAVAKIISDRQYGFASFTLPGQILKQMIYEVSMLDLEIPPKNKLRKVIFKIGIGLTLPEKLSIVGQMIGRSKKIDSDDIYACMIDLHDNNEKITIGRVSELLDVSSRTVHRYMCEELKREKELLNQQL
jgi:hypothetical protein